MDDGEGEELYVCYGCQKPIETTIIRACDLTYHLECFLCTNCRNPLSTRRFASKNGLPFCSTMCSEAGCLDKICARCNKVVEGSVMKAHNPEQFFHPNCFLCEDCGTRVALKTFFEVENFVYCSVCYKKKLDAVFA